MIEKILISKKWIDYIESRNLTKQYIKARKYLLNGELSQINFGIRKPKSDKIYYFRLNKQFIIWGYIDKLNFKIIKIDNHQI